MRYLFNWLVFAAVPVVLCSNAGAAPNSAYAVIDWSSLEVSVVGDGGLVAVDDPFIANHAVMTNEDLVPLSAQHSLFAPAFAGHPLYGPTGSGAGFADAASSTAANALVGSSAAESTAAINFAAFGSGTALITVGYAIAADIGTPLPVVGAASANVHFGLDLSELDDGFVDGLLYDGAAVHRADRAGLSSDTGYLALSFFFDVGEFGHLGLVGSATSSAVGALAFSSSAASALAAPVPVPAAFPLMLGAIGLFGATARRTAAV